MKVYLLYYGEGIVCNHEDDYDDCFKPDIFECKLTKIVDSEKKAKKQLYEQINEFANDYLIGMEKARAWNDSDWINETISDFKSAIPKFDPDTKEYTMHLDNDEEYRWYYEERDVE